MFNYFFSRRSKHKNFLIEPEEIFLDSLNNLQFDRERLEGTIERSLPGFSFKLFLIFAIIIFLGIVWRIADLQVVHGNEFQAQAAAQSITVSTTIPPRGLIFDSQEKQLAGNLSSFDLVFYKSEFLKEGGSLNILRENLSHFFSFTEEDFHFFGFKEGGTLPRQVTILRDVDTVTTLFLKGHSKELPGVIAEERTRRVYTGGPALAPIIGYLGASSQEEREKMSELTHDSLSGKLGLELQYGEVLQGHIGKKIIQVDAERKIQKIKSISDAEAGNDLYTTLDGELQQKSYQVLETHLRANGKRAGAIVILDPQSGVVRALVTYPSFQNAFFTKRLSQKDFDTIFLNPDKPLFNRAIAGEYPPGSTIKPIIASAALEEKIINPLKKIFSAGFIRIPNPFKIGEFSTFLDWKALGWVDLRQALAYSSNVYFYTVGGGFENQQGLGVERIKKYAILFGLYQPLGIDLPGEKSGFVPDPFWKSEKKPKDPIWRVGDTYNISIGQGDMLVTPLQVASYTSVFANRGTLFKPYIVQKIINQKSKETVREFYPTIIRNNFISRDTIQIVREGMRLVVSEGTARQLNNVSVMVSGKTGTAETGRLNEAHAWFTGFAPYENPEIVITVLVEKGGEGSMVAVPIAKEILEWYFGSPSRIQQAQ